MQIPDHPTRIRASLNARLARLGGGQPMLTASLVEVHKRCGRKTCRCATQGQLRTAWHLTLKADGKTRTVYVPLDLLDEVRTWIDNHHRHKTLLHEIHQLTLALVQTHAQHQRRKRGRP